MDLKTLIENENGKKKTQKKMSMADLVHAQIAYHAASKWTGRYKILAVIMRNI